ncbi:N-acetylmuramic acid 6-phosphate etherase [Allopontixanthobacter sediminis]|uniref:N-acetylmuramic acid 6-phosphate etherase n=1 Tax=Allopontixanthobacter sediminis TaxID=1689985 RepID=A0A845B324_9SPHN|nr:N-acetylmuramic acid 6-phosphate etherase [Allopontixanthobacter sediminis]MXP44544.1 N-acetylmuramic acid 6-phosphate etherase [Allopontixanthobacter sediminis]
MTTELIDCRFAEIDQWPTISAVEAMLEGHMAALAAIRSQSEMIAAAADAAAIRLGPAGRLIYAGAGTSGRIAVQDGVELYPTFNWPRSRLVFLMAGGLAALVESAEGAEDDAEEGKRQVSTNQVGANDVVIGVAASGSTPFTVAVIRAAKERGALTVGLSSNIGSQLEAQAEFGICVQTGSEVIAGSTRMKAGTAQKVVLNTLSTAIMLRRGLVFNGMMVNLRISNEKLLARGHAMIRTLAGVDQIAAEHALEQADRRVLPAVLIALGADRNEADRLITANNGNPRAAITAMQTSKETDA